MALARQLLIQQWKPLLFIFVLGCLISLQLEEGIRQLTPADEGSRWMMQLSLGLWDLFEGVMVFLVLSWGIIKVLAPLPPTFDPHPFEKSYIGSFLAEYLRLLGQVLLYGLLLFIPGLIRYCRLIFVPYIALFSKQYRADQVDALELSASLSKAFFGKIMGVFLLVTVIQIVLEFLPHLLVELHVWPVRVLLMGVSLVVGAWIYSYMFLLFERSLSKNPEN